MIISKIASKVEKIILYLLGFVLLFSLILFFFLLKGIEIDKISISGNDIKGFYLKLDKKLVLKVEKISLTALESNSEDMSAKQIADIAQNIKLLLDYFELIEVDSINFGEYSGSLKFDGEEILLDTQDISFIAGFSVEKELIIVQADSILAKAYGLNVFGTMVYDLNKKNVDFGGSFVLAPDITGSIAVKSDLKSAEIELSTGVFSSILPLKGLVVLASDEANSWVYEKITPKEVKVDRFWLAIRDIDNPENIKKDDIYLDFWIKDASVKFQPKLLPASVKTLKGELKDNQFLFTLDGGAYKNVNLLDSFVLISDIFTDGKSALYLSLKSKTAINDAIKEILNSYGINMPLTQTKGVSDAFINLKLLFSDLETDVKGNFFAKDSEFSIGSFVFASKDANATLDNAKIELKNASFIIHNLLNSRVSGIIDTKKGEFRSDVFLKNFSLKVGSEELLSVTDRNISTVLDFSKKDAITLNIPQMESEISFLEHSNRFDIKDFALLHKDSPFLQKFGIYSGEGVVTTRDFKEFDIKGEIKSDKIPLVEKGRAIEELNITASIKGERVNIEDGAKRVSALIDKTPLIKLSGVDLNISDKLLGTEENATKKSAKTEYPELRLEAKHSNIYYKNKELSADSYRIDMGKNGVKLNLNYLGGELNIKEFNGAIKIDSSDLNYMFINRFAKKELLEGGSFLLSGDTNENMELVGKLTLKNTTLSDMASINNLLAFFDTIPSLAILKAPGFNNQGIAITQGVIDFRYKDDLLILTSINLQGPTMNIVGSGFVNFHTNQMTVPLRVQTMKSLSSIIDAIPVVNYIILGKEGSVSVGVELSGDINNPKVTTSTLQDIATSPFNIIKRIIETPFRIFE